MKLAFVSDCSPTCLCDCVDADDSPMQTGCDTLHVTATKSSERRLGIRSLCQKATHLTRMNERICFILGLCTALTLTSCHVCVSLMSSSCVHRRGQDKQVLSTTWSKGCKMHEQPWQVASTTQAMADHAPSLLLYNYNYRDSIQCQVTYQHAHLS